jgi:hypothetical protein
MIVRMVTMITSRIRDRTPFAVMRTSLSYRRAAEGRPERRFGRPSKMGLPDLVFARPAQKPAYFTAWIFVMISAAGA